MADEPTSIEPHDFAQSVMDMLSEDVVETDTGLSDTATAPEQSVTAEPALTADEHGNLHGPDGKFVAKGTEEEQVAEEEQTTEEVPVDEADTTPQEWELDIDPEIEGFLAKYDGDLNKALRGALEAQKQIGRQGSELGELRKLESKIDELQQLVNAKASAPAFDHTNYGALIEQDPRKAAMVARDNENWDAMAAAVDAWREEDPFEASVFLTTTVNQVELKSLREEYEKRLTGLAAPTPAASSDEQEVAKVLQAHPDLEKFLPVIGQIAQERPLLSGALQNGSPAEKADALETLYLIARSRSDADTSSDAVKRARVRAATEGQQARADAAVVSASRGSAASAGSPTKVDQFLDAFDTHLRSRGLMASEDA